MGSIRQELTFNNTSNENDELSNLIINIRNPLWINNAENFRNKCMIRELLQKISGDKIIEMLQNILSAEEKIGLEESEIDSFFRNQARCDTRASSFFFFV